MIEKVTPFLKGSGGVKYHLIKDLINGIDGVDFKDNKYPTIKVKKGIVFLPLKGKGNKCWFYEFLMSDGGSNIITIADDWIKKHPDYIKEEK